MKHAQNMIKTTDIYQAIGHSVAEAYKALDFLFVEKILEMDFL